jgi:hypothetical protein
LSAIFEASCDALAFFSRWGDGSGLRGKMAFGLDKLADGDDTVGDFLGGVIVAVGVVGADHQDRQLRRDPVEMAVLQPPENILGAVAAETHVDGIARGIVLVPKLRHPFPAVGDRVADHEQIDMPLLDALVDRVVADRPPAMKMLRSRGGILRGLGQQGLA